MTDPTDLDDANARLSVVAQLASALQDHLVGDSWHLAYAISRVARREITVDEALADTD
jgi:hypothetical protein